MITPRRPAPASSHRPGSPLARIALPLLALVGLTRVAAADEYRRAVIEALVNETQAREGTDFPTRVVPGPANAHAGRFGVTVNTGLRAAVVPGAVLHEDGHEFFGDDLARVPLQPWFARIDSVYRELRADQFAGHELIARGFSPTFVRSYLRFVARAGSDDHGSGAQRVRATARGIFWALRGF